MLVFDSECKFLVSAAHSSHSSALTILFSSQRVAQPDVAFWWTASWRHVWNSDTWKRMLTLYKKKRASAPFLCLLLSSWLQVFSDDMVGLSWPCNGSFRRGYGQGKQQTKWVECQGSLFTVSKKSRYRLRVMQILAALICSSLVFVFGDSGEKSKQKVHLILEQ